MSFWQIMWYACKNPSLVRFRNPWRFVSKSDLMFIIAVSVPCLIFCFFKPAWIAVILGYVFSYSVVMLSAISWISGSRRGRIPNWTFFVGTHQNLEFTMTELDKEYFYVGRYINEFKSNFPDEEIFVEAYSRDSNRVLFSDTRCSSYDQDDIYISATFLNKNTAVQARLMY